MMPTPLCADGLEDAYKAFEKGQYEEAAKAFENHSAKQPEDFDQLYNAGVALFQKGEMEAASKFFDRAKQAADPQLKSRAAYNKGVAMGQQQRWAEAETEFQEALSYDNDNVKIQENLQFAREQKQQQKQQQNQSQNESNNDPNQQQAEQKHSPDKSQEGKSSEQDQKQADNQSAADEKNKSSDQADSQSKFQPQTQASEPKDKTGSSEAKDGKPQQQPAQSSAENKGSVGKEAAKGATAEPGSAQDDASSAEPRGLTLKDLKQQEAEKLLRSVDDRIGSYILTPEQANTEGKSRNGKDW
jgi:Ca-activated chloride channel family protein